MAIMGFYFTLYGIAKIMPSKKKVEAAETVAVASSDSNEIPSIESPEFAEWISVSGNIEKMLA